MKKCGKRIERNVSFELSKNSYSSGKEKRVDGGMGRRDGSIQSISCTTRHGPDIALELQYNAAYV